MSHEAIASVRKRGSIGAFETKWLTVPTDSVSDAMARFHAMGFEVNSCRVVSQDEATRRAAIIARVNPAK